MGSRINNQVRRGLHRIEEALLEVERNQSQLQTNADTVVKEIDEINRRLTLALKERTDYLKSSVDKYVLTEMKSLKELKDNLDLEVTNIQSNSDLMEKNLDDGTKWDDVELMDCKDIFIKMMDWIRNYDTSNEEYTRKIRFTSHDGVNDLAKRILEIGDLKMQENKPKDSDDFESRSSGLSRSKSDHRLVSEFRRQEENSSPPVRRRAFGENRYSREANKSRTNLGRYGGEDEEEESAGRSSRFRSRFLRGDEDEEGDRRNSRHLEGEEAVVTKKERSKVIETEDASRGPLSGCIRLADSSRVIQRLKEREMELLRPKKKDTPPPAPKPAAPKPAPPPTRPSGAAAKDDDEIDRIKQENKAKDAASATATATTTAPTTQATATTVTSTPSTTTTPPSTIPVPARRTSVSQQPTPPAPVVAASAPVRPARASTTATPPAPEPAPRVTSPPRASQTASVTGSKYTSRAGSPSSIVNRYASSQPAPQTSYGASLYGQGTGAQEASPDSDFSSSDSDSSIYSDSDDDDDEEEAVAAGAATTVIGDDGWEDYDEEDETPALAPVTPAGPSSILKKSDPVSYGGSTYGTGSSSQSQQAGNSSYGSYGSYGASSYGGAAQETPSRNTSAYGSSATSSYGASRTEAEQTPGRAQKSYSGARTTAYGGSWGQEPEQATPMSPGTSRRYSRYTSPEPTSSALSERRFSREDSSDSGAGYSNRYKRRDDTDSFVSRYLAKSRTSAGLTADSPKSATPEETVSASRRISGELQYPSGRSRYAALKERKAKLAKSKSSATIGLGNNEEEEEDDADSLLTPFTSRFGSELARSRSSHLLKDQNSPSSSSTSRQDVSSEQDENLSSWAKYLKNKYGGRGAASGAQAASRDREAEKEERRSRLGLSSARPDYEPPKNVVGSPAPTPQQPSVGSAGGLGSLPKSQYLQKQALVLKFGARGSQPGFFTWPRGIAVGPDNTIVVADSSNH